MRTFIAIEFDSSLKEYLWDRLQLIKKNALKGNFTSLENFHMTLNFIGEVTLHQVDLIKEAINSALSDIQPFYLKLSDLGQFSRGNSSILWIGTDKSSELKLVFKKLKASLESFGFALEKRGLTPHITLGREVILNTDFKTLSQLASIEKREICVDKISLMESKRIGGCLMYIPIYSKAF